MKKIVFLTGTRADFGKLKSLIEITEKSKRYEVHIFVTGMHMNPKYGKTADEVIKCGYKNIFMYYNHDTHDPMDIILAKTIVGFTEYINDIKPDLIVLHGDRVEALAGAIVGALNNVLTAHIEGGELSGTVDELIRHSVSKMCHIHFVSNNTARRRLIQMGEEKNSIFVIGSPDIDIMMSKKFAPLNFIKKHYNIPFKKYAVLLFHPVVTEHSDTGRQARNLVDAVLKSKLDYVVIYPNNDTGSDFIFSEYKRLQASPHIRMFPSIRFEYFLVLLRQANFIIGNSSVGVREAPYYGIPVVNIGTRQNNRHLHPDMINCGYASAQILAAIEKALSAKPKPGGHFGKGNSDRLFLKILDQGKLWLVNKQKQFRDIPGPDK
jgi:UDP-N-acetylglucosamine 2-epimerase (hydrolysing)